MLVKDYMTANPITITSDTSLMEAGKLLRKHNFRRLPIMSDDNLVGIITDRDLRDAGPSKANALSVYELNYILNDLNVEEIMKSPVITVQADDDIKVAAQYIIDKKISGLPVMTEGRLVGIITITDILQALMDNA